MKLASFGGGQSSAVGTVTRLRAGRSEFRILVGSRHSSVSPKRPDMFWGSPSLLLSEYPSPFNGVMRLRPEAVHLLPSIAEVYSDWSSTSTPLPPYAYTALTGTTLLFIVVSSRCVCFSLREVS